MKNSLFRSIGKVTAFSSVLVMGTMGLTATMAQAADGDPTPDTIQTNRTGSITIHKHEFQTGSSPVQGNAGSTEDPIPSKAVKDVVFKAFPISNAPLTGDGANAGWALINSASSNLSTACNSVTATSGTPTVTGLQFGEGLTFDATDQSGVSTKNNLQLGAYLLCEVSAPASVTQPAAPFIVTVPTPDKNATTAGSAWLYDVNVFPKNSVVNINKTVNELSGSQLAVGSDIIFPVTSTITARAENTYFDAYIFEDTFDSRLGSPSVDSVTLGETKMEEKTDYTVTVDEENPQKISVSFTRTGLNKIEQAAVGTVITVNFKGKVTSLGNDGIIPNTARVWNNPKTGPKPEEPNLPPVPPTIPPNTPDVPTTPTVTTRWGGARIIKTDKATGGVLQGAKFQVFEAQTPYPENGVCGTEISTAHPDAINFDGVGTTLTTNENGVINIPGLFVSDSVHAPTDSLTRCYVLVETEAPSGYVLPENPNVALQIHAGPVAAGNDADHQITVVNTKSNVPNLPLTGGAGTLALTVVGVALVGSAGALFVTRRRRMAADAQ